MHVTRIWKYDRLIDSEKVQAEALDLTDQTAAKYKIVDKIVDIDCDGEDIWTREQWNGMLNERDFTCAHFGRYVQNFLRDSLAQSEAYAEQNISKRHSNLILH